MSTKPVLFSSIKSRTGMTLLNVIMLLMLLGVLVVAGYSLIGPLAFRGKINDTKTSIKSAVDAIISWSAANGRLPTAAESQTILPNPNDAWGKPLVYIYDANLTDTATGGGLCGRISTNLRDTTVHLAFAIISGGDDFSIETTANGVPVSVSAPVAVLTALANYQTDQYRAVPLEELKNRAGCYGQTGGRLMIVNNELPRVCSGSPYNAMLFAAGGAPAAAGEYRWCITSALPGTVAAKGGSETIPICPTFSTGSYANIQFSGNAPTPAVTTDYPVSVRIQDSDIANAPTPYVERTYKIKTVVGGVCTSNPTGGGGDGGIVTTDPTTVVGTTPAPFVVNNGRIEFGRNLSNSSGCIWYPYNLPLLGKTMRAYWNFCYAGNDASPTSSTYGDGYTFTLMQASNPVSYCGSGSTYDAITNPRFDCSLMGGLGEYLSYCGLPGNSNALEFDIYPSAGRNDPAGSYNHLAVVKGITAHKAGAPVSAYPYGDNTHNQGGNPACNGTDTGCLFDAMTGHNYPVTWLENTGCNAGYDNNNVRVELHTRCNSDCSQCETPACTTKSLYKVWINGNNSNLGSDDPTAPDLSSCADLPATLNQYKVGFTEATGGAVQYGYIGNFMLKSYGACPLAIISPATLPVGTVGVPYSATMSASGGTPPYSNWSWSASVIPGIAASNLPPGLSMSSAGVISGTPTTAGTYNTALISVNDACTADTCANTVSQGYAIQVNNPPAPTCTLSAAPSIVAYNSTTLFTWGIVNGPVDGTWSTAPGGSCGNFTGSSGGNCTSGSLTFPGTTIYTLTVSNPGGSDSCPATVNVGCLNYRVWNAYGSRRDFRRPNGVCVRVNNGAEITNAGSRLAPGQSITGYSSSNTTCSGSVLGTITYNNTMNVDIAVNGGNGDCQANFGVGGTPTDR